MTPAQREFVNHWGRCLSIEVLGSDKETRDTMAHDATEYFKEYTSRNHTNRLVFDLTQNSLI